MAEATAKFEKHVIKRWGTPKTVLGDNAFKGVFKDMCDKFGIHLENSLPLQKNTVGLVERCNRTVEEILRNYVNSEFRNWPALLPDVQFAINSGVSTHGMSPMRVATGREPVSPVERVLDPPAGVNHDGLTADSEDEHAYR